MEEREPRKSRTWAWVLVIVIVLAGVGGGVYFLIQKDKATDSQETSSTKGSKTASAEKWETDGNIVLANTTSSDTHKISDNLYRMYYMGQGGILYAESSDGVTFSKGLPTGVTEDSGKMLSNPAVLEISEGKWLMIYEQQPQKGPGSSQKTPPGPSTQRNLYRATSTDGKTFTKVGLAIDSSENDNYFASVPDLVLLPDNSIAIYYVSGGEGIALSTSIDEGRTWNWRGIVFKDGVDPDIIKTNTQEEKWLMYYSLLDPTENAVYKAASDDGENWTVIGKVLDPENKSNAIVDPDIVEISVNNYMMFYGMSEGATSTSGDTINLYRATYVGEIFN